MYWVTVMARDDRGIELTQTFSQTVHLPLTAGRPASSGSLALGAGRLWVVNQDNDTVSVFDAASNAAGRDRRRRRAAGVACRRPAMPG